MRNPTWLFLLSLSACGSDAYLETDGGQDAASTDSSSTDSGQKDSSSSDSGTDSGVTDAGTDAKDSGLDGSIPLDGGSSDSGIVCGNRMGGGFQGMGQCGASESYMCGNDKYDIDCQCPAATCTCKKNNQNTMTLNNVNGCPQCTFTFSTLAAQCGFPY